MAQLPSDFLGQAYEIAPSLVLKQYGFDHTHLWISVKTRRGENSHDQVCILGLLRNKFHEASSAPLLKEDHDLSLGFLYRVGITTEKYTFILLLDMSEALYPKPPSVAFLP